MRLKPEMRGLDLLPTVNSVPTGRIFVRERFLAERISSEDEAIRANETAHDAQPARHTARAAWPGSRRKNARGRGRSGQSAAPLPCVSMRAAVPRGTIPQLRHLDHANPRITSARHEGDEMTTPSRPRNCRPRWQRCSPSRCTGHSSSQARRSRASSTGCRHRCPRRTGR